MKKFITFIILIALCIIGVRAGQSFSNKVASGESVLPASVVNTTDSGATENEVAVSKPQRLSIPSIEVDTEVESVAQDSKGAMDVPQNSDNVAWYNLGPKPADMGSSVLAGHKDEVSGAPSVFWDIKKLSKGDKIIVTDESGEDHTFSVTEIAEYPDANFPLQKVFNTQGKRLLNLITCGGVWDSKAGNYSHRTVVYSEHDE